MPVDKRRSLLALGVFLLLFPQEESGTLKLNDPDYFEIRGLNMFVFSNWYNDLFLELLPSAYFNEAYLMDGGVVPFPSTWEDWWKERNRAG